MKFSEKYDNVMTGVISGLILPFIVGLTIYMFSSGHQSLHSYLARIAASDIITHSITLCVFPNILIFMLFNRFDMLKATRGVLAMTISMGCGCFWCKVFRMKYFIIAGEQSGDLHGSNLVRELFKER